MDRNWEEIDVPRHQEGARASDRIDVTIGQDGYLREVRRWALDDGADLRVVRWALRGSARRLVDWARGQANAGDDWTLGVCLERRDEPTARWQSVRRQELTTDDDDTAIGRLRGWEAGLLDRGHKLASARQAAKLSG